MSDGRSPFDRVLSAPSELDAVADALGDLGDRLPSRVNADPDNVERGLVQLVMTLVELLRQLMERQAIRRIEGGTLTDDEIERLGQTFLKLEARMAELREVFGLSAEDLNLDLGPLGDLL
jgi:hypothetical protein